MAYHPTEHFDPYSPEALESVEIVEELPFSRAFEHAMFEHRIERRATYCYDFEELEDDYGQKNLIDKAPFVINHELKLTQFPQSLIDIFPEVSYTISHFQAQLIDTPDGATLAMKFRANDSAHSVTFANGITSYTTVNESLEEVTYQMPSEASIALLATFLYARQYDPSMPHQSISLTENNLQTDRDATTRFIEEMIATMGDLGGSSSIETVATFQKPDGNFLIAALREEEYPDMSKTGSTLELDELQDINELTTATRSVLYETVTNVPLQAWFIPSGEISNRYAKLQTSVMNAPLSTTEYLDPKAHYQRWARLCDTFLRIIEKPMQKYAYLDEPSPLD